MTREEFDKLSSEEINKMRDNIKSRKLVKEELTALKDEIKPLYEEYKELNSNINEWLNKFNNELNEDIKDSLLEEATKIKERKSELEVELDSLEQKIEEKNKEYYALLDTKEFNMYVKFSKEAIKNANKVVVDTSEGVKTTKKEINEVELKEEKIPLRTIVARKFAKKYVDYLIKKQEKNEKVIESKEKKEEDISDVVEEFEELSNSGKKLDNSKMNLYLDLYNKINSSNIENKEKYKDMFDKRLEENNKLVDRKTVSKFKINKKTSAIAKATGAIAISARNTFYELTRLGGKLGNKIYIKSERLKLMYAAKMKSKEEYAKLREEKKNSLEGYKNLLEERIKLQEEEIAENYQEAKKIAKSA